MIAYCYAVWEEFINFIGGKPGLLHWVLFIAALACCLFMGKGTRKKLFWPSVFVMLFFFNPIFYAYVGTRFLSGIYWRLLWMLPISFVIAYVFTQMSYKIKKEFVRIGAVILSCVCIIVTGERIFTGETYNEKENDYELPQSAIDISDVMMAHLQSWKETAIVPNEFLCYIRQYTCSIGLLYGRNFGGFITEIGEAELQVYQEMSKEEPDVEFITDIAKEKNCRYIVFNESFHQFPEDLTEYGYERFEVVDEIYAIYRRLPG